MIFLILGNRAAFLLQIPSSFTHRLSNTELEISTWRRDIFSSSLVLAGGLESQGFLVFVHHWAWCWHDAGVAQEVENPLRLFKAERFNPVS